MSRLSTGKEYEKGVLYCTVRWSNHNNNVNQFMSTNYAEERYTDVSIACEGQIIKAHKMILAGCSPYFEALFNQYDAKLQPAGQQMCVVLDGMGLTYSTLQLILEFMYGGEIRVKKSDLEALVKGGIKLRVKGLDAVKLGDKQFEKPMEPRTVIGRSELKSPQAVKVPGTRPPTQPPVPAQSRRRLSDLLPKSWSVSNPKPTPPNKMVQRLNIPVSPEPVSPKAPRTEPPGSGDSDEDTPKLPEEHSNDKQSVELPSAERLSKETTPVESLIDKQPDPPVEPRSRSSSRTRSQKKSAAIPEESVEQPEESLSSSAPNESELKSEESVKTDTEENGESDVVSSKRRIIKKPARLSDPDFVKEINVPPVKKRKVRDSPLRKKLAEETAEPPTEEVAAPAEAPKKRSKGVFSIFCQEFREKLQEENPGESNSEVTRRLSTMWRNLEPTEKEKYCHPPKVTKK